MTDLTPLCKIAYKYGTDKCPQIAHLYTPYYYQLFKGRQNSIKKVVEIGIGMPQTFPPPPKDYHYVVGASLRMWRDFFPNATVYGADIVPEAIFEDERIKTFLCDETKKEDLEKLIKNVGSDIDLFVDDGFHSKEAQIFLCKTVLPMLNKKVIYIIEDVGFPKTISAALCEYKCTTIHLNYTPKTCGPKNRIILVEKNG